MANPASAEDELEATVAAVRADPSTRHLLVDLLAESSPVYEGRGMATTARLRGWVLAAFEDVGLPAEAGPYVLEELESGIEPHLVAAAARAARGGERHPELGPCLLAAFENLVNRDDTVTFEAFRPRWPPERPTTALLEILETVRWLGPIGPVTAADWRDQQQRHGDRLSAAVAAALAETVVAVDGPATAPMGCCGSPEPSLGDGEEPVPQGWEGVVVEDQDAQRYPLGSLLSNRPTVVAFFYTRCPNPNKCSLTIRQLAEAQRLLIDQSIDDQVGLLALSYDPGYDGPDRLLRYGQDRGIRFGPTARLARAVAGHDQLRAGFRLRVGYRDTIVNRHAIEVFLVDSAGVIVATWARRRWDPAEIVVQAAALAAGPKVTPDRLPIPSDRAETGHEATRPQ